jgi:hypothetical protein
MEDVVLAGRVQGNAVVVLVHAQVDATVVGALDHLHPEHVGGEAAPPRNVADTDANVRHL